MTNDESGRRNLTMTSEELRSEMVALSSDDVVAAAEAAERLTHMGPAAQLAAVGLVRACGSKDATVRAWAARRAWLVWPKRLCRRLLADSRSFASPRSVGLE